MANPDKLNQEEGPRPPLELKLPDGFALVRSTPRFDETTVPAGLLRAHLVADGVWGRLVVSTGELGFVFEDDPEKQHAVCGGEHVIIPPLRPHHVVVGDPVSFFVEFHRRP